MKEKQSPTNEDLMNPESPHFSQDWWKLCLLDHSKPWAYIVSDYQWSWGVLSEALRRVPEFNVVEIGHYPETNSPKEHIIKALSTAYRLQADLESMISVQCVDINFAWTWGEYQKAIALLVGALPDLDKTKSIRFHAKQISEDKAEAREWYALWFEWYKKDRAPRRVYRSTFDKFFVKFLKSLQNDKRTLPPSLSVEEIQNLVSQFKGEPEDNEPEEDKENFFLAHFFTTKKFGGEEFKRTLLSARKNAAKLPPVGESFYPLK